MRCTRFAPYYKYLVFYPTSSLDYRGSVVPRQCQKRGQTSLASYYTLWKSYPRRVIIFSPHLDVNKRPGTIQGQLTLNFGPKSLWTEWVY